MGPLAPIAPLKKIKNRSALFYRFGADKVGPRLFPLSGPTQKIGAVPGGDMFGKAISSREASFVERGPFITRCLSERTNPSGETLLAVETTDKVWYGRLVSLSRDVSVRAANMGGCL